MKAQLSIVNEAVTMPGVAFFSNGIIFDGDSSIEKLNQLAAKIVEMQGGVQWWLGDVGLAIQAQKGDDYMRGRAEIMGIDEGYWRNCVCVARFYPVSHRCDTKSWSHHREAMRAAGGAATGEVKKAELWLEQAKENKWTKADLRRQINISLATTMPPATAPEANPFERIDALDTWLGTKPDMPAITPHQARAQLVRWQSIVGFVHQLETIAALH